MIRPRSGDFCYSDSEFNQMIDSLKLVKEIGAAGVVFGILNPDKTLDVQRMKTLVDLAQPMKVVCHKAFDETPNPEQALDTLIQLGINEVLTSGHCKTAVEGSSKLSQHLKRANGAIQIMAGGTVRAENIQSLIT